jgi:hypothetical protein
VWATPCPPRWSSNFARAVVVNVLTPPRSQSQRGGSPEHDPHLAAVADMLLVPALVPACLSRATYCHAVAVSRGPDDGTLFGASLASVPVRPHDVFGKPTSGTSWVGCARMGLCRRSITTCTSSGGELFRISAG